MTFCQIHRGVGQIVPLIFTDLESGHSGKRSEHSSHNFAIYSIRICNMIYIYVPCIMECNIYVIYKLSAEAVTIYEDMYSTSICPFPIGFARKCSRKSSLAGKGVVASRGRV